MPDHFGVLSCLLIRLHVDRLQVLDVNLELPLELIAVLFPGVIALHLITPDILVFLKGPIVDWIAGVC